MNQFRCGRFKFDRQIGRPLIMGILNVTPDSFSDGGRFFSIENALDHAEKLIADGADILDIGGESSRPGAIKISLQEELDRIMPIVYALRDCGKPISVDTCKVDVMREAIIAGADLINDISGFRDESIFEVLADSDVGLCVMHMSGNPSTMQVNPSYEDVLTDVINFLEQQVNSLRSAGIEEDRICIDPGFGFGKKLEHNIRLFKHIKTISQQLGLPALIGTSRKSMIGEMTGRDAEHRMAGSLAATLAAVLQDAFILRVHDVAETRDALNVWGKLV